MSNKNIFNCETCEKIFVNSFSLKRHMKAIHHSGILFKSKTTKCILCKDSVPSNEYNKHLVVNHQIKINTINMDFDNEAGIKIHPPKPTKNPPAITFLI